MAIYKLNEDNYGGIFDIDDDIFFTKEEIVEFGNDIAEEFDRVTNNGATLNDIWFKDPKTLIIEVEDNDYLYDSKINIDMRKIRHPRDLYKYKDHILRDLENQYNEFSSLNDMSYYESYKLKESVIKETFVEKVYSLYDEVEKLFNYVNDVEKERVDYDKKKIDQLVDFVKYAIELLEEEN